MYPRFKKTLACYPQSRDETLSKLPYAQINVDMNYPAIHIRIILFSYCPMYFISETKEDIQTYVDDK